MKIFNIILIGLIVILINIVFTVGIVGVALERKDITKLCNINRYHVAGGDKYQWVVSFSFDNENDALDFIYELYGDLR